MEHQQIEILLIEDDPDDAGLTMRTINKHFSDTRFVHLSDGEMALDFIFGGDDYNSGYCKTSTARIILLDILMPRIDGLQVLSRIRKDILTMFIPVVTLGFSDYDPGIEKAYKLGANAHIIKPLEHCNFLEIVTRFGLGN